MDEELLKTMTDEEIKSLQEDGYNNLKAMDATITDLVFDKLQSLTSLKLIKRPLSLNSHFGAWRDDDLAKLEVRSEIGFFVEGSTWQDGSPKADFGSTFDLTITDKYVEINHGCTGSFRKKSKFLVERLSLMSKVFEHEEELCSIISEYGDKSLLDDIHNMDEELQIRKNTRRQEEHDRQKNEIIEKIKNSKYFVELTSRYNFETNNYNKEYGCNYIINRVTEKNVINHEEYKNYNKDIVVSSFKNLTKLDHVVAGVMNGTIVLSNERLEGLVPTI